MTRTPIEPEICSSTYDAPRPNIEGVHRKHLSIVIGTIRILGTNRTLDTNVLGTACPEAISKINPYLVWDITSLAQI